MSKRKTVGLISAVPSESRHLIAQLRRANKYTPHVVKGSFLEHACVHITSGIGIANAAHAATLLILKYAPDLVILFGIGGAFEGHGLAPGDLAAADKEIYADLGVTTPSGTRGAEAIGIPVLKKGRKTFYNEFPTDQRLLKKVLQLNHAPACVSGPFVSVSEVTGTRARRQELVRRFSPVCENMEGAAAAHICTLYGVPFLEIRGISNMVGVRDHAKWDMSAASKIAQSAVLELIGTL